MKTNERHIMNNNNSTILDSVPMSRLDAKQAKAAYIAAFEPFEPGTEKHQRLIEWYRAEEKLDAVYAGMTASIERETNPGVLGHHYGSTFSEGIEFPETDGPAWATGHDDPGVDSEKNPTRLWLRTLTEEEYFTAQIVRDDGYDVDLGKVIEGDTVLTIGIDHNDQIEFINADLAREAARKMLAAADAFDAAVNA